MRKTTKRILVTGSSGLTGSEVCTYFSNLGWKVEGIDNNQRAVFFGKNGDPRWKQKRLETSLLNFQHYEIDIRDRNGILDLFKKIKPDAIVHAAGQPSHDKAAEIPFQDFETNANGTLNLLEATKVYCKESPFIFMSTNKVYGDGPNNIPLKEMETRWEYDSEEFKNGIPENFPIDHCKHSLFGVSKLAADVMVQEYGRYFDMPTCCLRAGCLTGPNHAGVELHGFLNYLIKCNLSKKKYFINGFKGKQVRDNLHSYDTASLIEAIIQNPKKAEVYNIGGGKENSCSILEAFDMVSNVTGNPMIYEYLDENRKGDHICYYSDLSKVKEHYPSWKIYKSLSSIFQEISNKVPLQF